MTVLAREYLVATVAWQHDRDLRARHPRDKIGGNLRSVSKRLVVQFRKQRNHVARVLRLHTKLRVVSAQMRGDDCGMARLVIVHVTVTDCETTHWPIALRLHQRHAGRRIDAAGKKCTERHVPGHASGDGIAQQLVECIDLSAWIEARIPPRTATLGYRACGQVDLGFGRLSLAPNQRRTRQQLAGFAIDRRGARYVGVAKIGRKRVTVESRHKFWRGAQRFQLRVKD